MSLPYLTCPSTLSTFIFRYLVSQDVIGSNTTGSVLDILLHTKCSLTVLILDVKVQLRLCDY